MIPMHHPLEVDWLTKDAAGLPSISMILQCLLCIPSDLLSPEVRGRATKLLMAAISQGHYELSPIQLGPILNGLIKMAGGPVIDKVSKLRGFRRAITDVLKDINFGQLVALGSVLDGKDLAGCDSLFYHHSPIVTSPHLLAQFDRLARLMLESERLLNEARTSASEWQADDGYPSLSLTTLLSAIVAKISEKRAGWGKNTGLEILQVTLSRRIVGNIKHVVTNVEKLDNIRPADLMLLTVSLAGAKTANHDSNIKEQLLPHFPQLFNICQLSSASKSPAGWQLRNFLQASIDNRTIAEDDIDTLLGGFDNSITATGIQIGSFADTRASLMKDTLMSATKGSTQDQLLAFLKNLVESRRWSSAREGEPLTSLLVAIDYVVEQINGTMGSRLDRAEHLLTSL